jgi:hypothetical protein
MATAFPRSGSSHPPAARALDGDGLNGARRSGAQHVLALSFVRLGVVPKRFLAVQLEHARRKETALRVGLTSIEVDDEPEGRRSSGYFGCA